MTPFQASEHRNRLTANSALEATRMKPRAPQREL